MTEAPTRRHYLDWKALWRWSASIGIMLGLLLAMGFYFGLENDTLSLGNAWEYEVLAYFLLIALVFFLVGFLRGWHTGESDEGVRISLLASSMQALTALLLLGLFSWGFHFWSMDRSGVLFALFGVDIERGGFGWAWWIGPILVLQIPLGVVAALFGTAIGSHSREKRSRPDEVAEP